LFLRLFLRLLLSLALSSRAKRADPAFAFVFAFAFPFREVAPVTKVKKLQHPTTPPRLPLRKMRSCEKSAATSSTCSPAFRGGRSTQASPITFPTCEGFTAQYRAFRLVYYEVFLDIRNAIAREKEIKSWTRDKKNHLILQANPSWRDLAADFGLETWPPKK
jgi:hypothetical protein